MKIITTLFLSFALLASQNTFAQNPSTFGLDFKVKSAINTDLKTVYLAFALMPKDSNEMYFRIIVEKTFNYNEMTDSINPTVYIDSLIPGKYSITVNYHKDYYVEGKERAYVMPWVFELELNKDSKDIYLYATEPTIKGIVQKDSIGSFEFLINPNKEITSVELSFFNPIGVEINEDNSFNISDKLPLAVKEFKYNAIQNKETPSVFIQLNVQLTFGFYIVNVDYYAKNRTDFDHPNNRVVFENKLMIIDLNKEWKPLKVYD